MHHHGILVMHGGELSYPLINQSEIKKRFYHLDLSVIKRLLAKKECGYLALNSWIFNEYD